MKAVKISINFGKFEKFMHNGSKVKDWELAIKYARENKKANTRLKQKTSKESILTWDNF